MNPTIILTITDAVTGAIALLPVAIEVGIRIRDLLSVDGSNFDVQVQAIDAGTIKTLDETDAIVKAWLDSHPETAA